MADLETLLKRWQTAGVLDAEAAGRIRAYEAEQTRPSGLRWQVMVALILGAILLACGVVLFVSAHWDDLGPGARIAIVFGMVTVFHVSGALVRKDFRGLSTTLHAVGTVSFGAAIALVGQIFNMQEHWPAAVLMWAIAALAGWALLQDEAQQTLVFLLFPAWILSEFGFAAQGLIGEASYIGSFLLAWGALYVTAFLGSKRRAVSGILFSVGAVASVVGIPFLLEGWQSWGDFQGSSSLGLRVWGWVVFGALPVLLSLIRRRKSLAPVAAAIALSLTLPWCHRIWTRMWGVADYRRMPYLFDLPNVAAQVLVAAYCVFYIWWGVRQASKALVNLGIVGFAITVAWFYFSDVFGKVGRSLGLIGLGILFLAGGWALEKMRRRLVAGMGQEGDATQEAL
ncbi:MAG: DUF2157 domain-containing protein [Terracidiphilus sp.]|jgi:uncharacterized membrane protein